MDVALCNPGSSLPLPQLLPQTSASETQRGQTDSGPFPPSEYGQPVPTPSSALTLCKLGPITLVQDGWKNAAPQVAGCSGGNPQKAVK